uniref:Uncharacterized protein n=1 Tax=Salix viminalis TaxID=40686 RepID=A0A6N2MR47_SALVM
MGGPSSCHRLEHKIFSRENLQAKPRKSLANPRGTDECNLKPVDKMLGGFLSRFTATLPHGQLNGHSCMATPRTGTHHDHWGRVLPVQT